MWDRAKKKWYAPKDVFETDRGGFSRWPQEQAVNQKDLNPPKISDYKFDWNAMLQAIAQKSISNDWGHLIIDEAQDFPKDMYGFLRFSSIQLENGNLTILADENQRLNEDDNSTIEQIIQNLAIPKERCYTLKQNYRNTYQIAKLANNFYVGLASGQPELPSRQGDIPQLIKTNTQKEQLEFIVRVLSNRAPGEVGVFVENNAPRKYFFEKLTERLGSQYHVQSYSSKESRMVDDMIFDEEGTLTVLNRQSCKGLEFDYVFVPELQNINIDGSNLDTFKMNMYVMCSRARDSLFLLYSSPGEIAEFLEHLPASETNILEYKDVSK